MPSRLICLRGAQEGSIFDLEPEGCGREDWTIGRESTNGIELMDLQASRAHAVLRPSDDQGWIVEDLSSTNGTFVNRQPVGRRKLESGDHVQIGGTVLLYLETNSDGPGEVGVDTEPWPVASTFQIHTSESWARKPAGSQPASQNQLAALLEITAALKGSESLPGLQRELLKRVMEWIPADRAAVLALEPETKEILSAYGWRRLSGCAQVTVSRSVIEQVCSAHTALLSHFGEGSAPPSESIRNAGVKSLIAAPMLERGQSIGILYLDTLEESQRLTADALQFASAVAELAAQPLESARRLDQLESENRRLETDLGRGFDMVGDSPAMQKLYVALGRIAPTDSTVLILGETGSGKEMVASAIHARSRRKQGPFIAINCAAIAESLLESEMFGHERGAFTGAVAQKRGKIELANGGTLFLDEIGELPLPAQAKLLRVLEHQELDRVGGTRPVPLNVRLVAATNRDLGAMMAEGRFRADLYYRLNVVTLRLPALRERSSDIMPLANYFLSQFANSTGRVVRGFAPRARKALTSYDWPGNVRELRNAVERGLVLGHGEWIEAEDLPDEIVEAQPPAPEDQGTYQALVLDAKRRILESALAQAGGRYVEASRILGIHSKHLHRLMRNYGLKEPIDPPRREPRA